MVLHHPAQAQQPQSFNPAPRASLLALTPVTVTSTSMIAPHAAGFVKTPWFALQVTTHSPVFEYKPKTSVDLRAQFSECFARDVFRVPVAVRQVVARQRGVCQRVRWS
jgi:hypothetical protein